MKAQLVFILLLITISTISTLKLSENSSTSVESSSYSKATVNLDSYYMNNKSNFKSPQIVEVLPQVKNLRGEKTSVEEIKTDSNYYDGSIKINTKTENVCGQWVSQPDACKKVGNCGWCASTSSCIPGNAFGALLPCQKGAFEFVTPPKDWNPFPADKKVIIKKEKVGDNEVVTVTPQQ